MNTQEEEYVTLFCEGDGGVGVYDSRNKKKKYPHVYFGQGERSVLDYIESLTEGGHVYTSGDAWQLEFNGSHCIPLLEMFSRYVVGKQFLGRLNTVLAYLSMPLAVQHPLTLEGFVAFWDAEGSSAGQPSISITQKDREIPDLIAAMFGGCVSLDKRSGVHHWSLGGDKACELYKVVLERSHCPSRAERLRQSFEGPSYYEEHAEACRVHADDYYKAHLGEREQYRAGRKDEVKAYDKKRGDERRAIREWMKAHPEEVEGLQRRISK